MAIFFLWQSTPADFVICTYFQWIGSLNRRKGKQKINTMLVSFGNLFSALFVRSWFSYGPLFISISPVNFDYTLPWSQFSPKHTIHYTICIQTNNRVGAPRYIRRPGWIITGSMPGDSKIDNRTRLAIAGFRPQNPRIHDRIGRASCGHLIFLTGGSCRKKVCLWSNTISILNINSLPKSVRRFPPWYTAISTIDGNLYVSFRSQPLKPFECLPRPW